MSFFSCKTISIRISVRMLLIIPKSMKSLIGRII